VGTHGRTGLKRVLLGSVAERTVRLADHSVLVARGAAPAAGYRHLVIGADLIAPTHAAYDQALPLAAAGARIDVIHGWQMSPLTIGAGGGLLADYRADLI